MKAIFVTLSLAILATASHASAATGGDISTPAASPLDGVYLDQRIGATLPASLTFTNEDGDRVRLADLAPGRPILLVPGFYHCPALCDVLFQNLVQSLRGVSLVPGKDFDLVFISIDPSDDVRVARAKKSALLDTYGANDTSKGWHVLVGDRENIAALSDAIGYHHAPVGKTFAHPAAIVLLDPAHRVNRYLVGLTTQPRDLQAAIAEAALGKPGGLTHAVLLRCFQYDPSTGRHGVVIQNALKVAGAVTLFALVASIVVLVRRSPSVAVPA